MESVARNVRLAEWTARARVHEIGRDREREREFYMFYFRKKLRVKDLKFNVRAVPVYIVYGFIISAN